jgi:hypothetical protein
LLVIKECIRRIQAESTTTPAKEKEHELTAVHREITEKIPEGGKEVPNPEAAKE